MDRHQDGDPGGGGDAKAVDPAILAAMMEELGVGRMDSLPLEDRGARVPVHVAQAAQNKARQPAGTLNAWHSMLHIPPFILAVD